MRSCFSWVASTCGQLIASALLVGRCLIGVSGQLVEAGHLIPFNGANQSGESSFNAGLRDGTFRSRASIVYYVAPTGNDNYSAAQATNRNTPWRTINKALQSIPVAGGCSVELATGIYRETKGIAINRFFTNPVTVYNSQPKPGQVNAVVQGTAEAVLIGGNSVSARRAGNIVFKGIQFGDKNYVASNAVFWYTDTKTRPAQMTKITFQACRFVSKAAELIYFRSDLSGDSSQGVFDISFENTYFQPGGDTNLIQICPNTATVAIGRPKNIRFLRCSAEILAPASFSARLFGDDISVTDCVFNATGDSAKALQFGTEKATTENLGVRCSNLIVSGGTFTSSDSHALLVGGGVTSGRISGVTVNGGDQGLVLKECRNVLVTGCTINMAQKEIAINGLYFKAARNCIATSNVVKGYSRDGGGLLAVQSNPVSGNLAADLQVVGNQFLLASDAMAYSSCVVWAGADEDATTPFGFTTFSENTLTKSRGLYGLFYGVPFSGLKSLTSIKYPTGPQGSKSVFN